MSYNRGMCQGLRAEEKGHLTQPNKTVKHKITFGICLKCLERNL